jgi:hypothetical protein
MHRWKVGDEVWAQFYHLGTDRYVARLYGRVIGVGPKGFAVRLVKPIPKQPINVRLPHDAEVWPDQQTAEAAIAKHPRPITPDGPRNMRGGGSG